MKEYKTTIGGELDKNKLINAVTDLNKFLSGCGHGAVYLVAAMKHLAAIHEENAGLTVDRINWGSLEKN